MFLWERLLRTLGYQRVRQVTFEARQDLLDAVQTLADQEQRPADQVTADLSVVLAQRGAAEFYLDCWEQLTPREQQVAARMPGLYQPPDCSPPFHCAGYGQVTRPQPAGEVRPAPQG